LKKILLPIGNLTKNDVRDKAKELGLGVHDKPDSQEICFVPDNDYSGFIKRYKKLPKQVKVSCIGEVTKKEAKRSGLVDS